MEKRKRNKRKILIGIFSILMAVMMVSFPTVSAKAEGTTIVPSKPSEGDGTANNPYKIGTVEELYWFAGLVDGTLEDGTEQNVSANAILTADITVNSGVLDSNGILRKSAVGGFILWTPIATSASSSSKYYKGTFDGNGHIISGLYAQSSKSYCGLFGRCTGKIKNLGLVDSFFGDAGQAYSNVGSFVGYGNADCLIENCFSSSAVSASYGCGGLAGKYSGTVRNSYYCGIIYAKGDIDSIAYKDSIINPKVENCFFSGSNGVPASYATKKTVEEFASGEVCYLLNNGMIDDVMWRQDLGVDTYPSFVGACVGKIEGGDPEYINICEFDAHVWSDSPLVLVEPTCEKEGYGLYECTKCKIKPANRLQVFF